MYSISVLFTLRAPHFCASALRNDAEGTEVSLMHLDMGAGIISRYLNNGTTAGINQCSRGEHRAIGGAHVNRHLLHGSTLFREEKTLGSQFM